MKKILLSLLALFCCFIGQAANGLVITFSDNTTQTFVLSSLPQVTMANDKMTITAGSTTAEYDLYKVKTFTFSATNGIETIENSTSIISQGDRIIIQGANASVNIFALDGKNVKPSIINLSYTTEIDITSLDRGVYIIKANDKTVKISKK